MTRNQPSRSIETVTLNDAGGRYVQSARDVLSETFPNLPPEAFDAIIAPEGRLAMLALMRGQPAGVITLSYGTPEFKVTEEARVEHIGIRENYRHAQVATQLLRTAEGFAADIGKRAMTALAPKTITPFYYSSRNQYVFAGYEASGQLIKVRKALPTLPSGRPR